MKNTLFRKAPRMIALTGILLGVFAAAHTGAAPNAQVALPARPPGSPDVQVLIISGLGAEDQVNFTYPGIVPQSQVQRDLGALAQSAAWPMHHLTVTNSALPMAGVKTPPMTSVTFSAANVVPQVHATQALEPLVVALRSYSDLAITFVAPPQYDFTGLRNYSDRYVAIALAQSGSTYTYRVHVSDPRFTHLNLPLWQPNPATVRDVQREQQDKRRRVVGIVVVTVLAAAVGVGVYAFLIRLH